MVDASGWTSTRAPSRSASAHTGPRPSSRALEAGTSTPTKPRSRDDALELADRGVGLSQRQCPEAEVAVRVAGDTLGERVVEGGGVGLALARGVVGADVDEARQQLHLDAAGVHPLQPRVEIEQERLDRGGGEPVVEPPMGAALGLHRGDAVQRVARDQPLRAARVGRSGHGRR